MIAALHQPGRRAASIQMPGVGAGLMPNIAQARPMADHVAFLHLLLPCDGMGVEIRRLSVPPRIIPRHVG